MAPELDFTHNVALKQVFSSIFLKIKFTTKICPVSVGKSYNLVPWSLHFCMTTGGMELCWLLRDRV